MKAVDRQRGCPNCSGKISVDVGQCPHCFAQVPVEAAKTSSLQESFNSRYAPPYQPKSSLTSNFLVNEEKKFFGATTEKSDELVLPDQPSSKEGLQEKEWNKSFWPILALSVGGNLFVLGILQFFFADSGVVKLEMNAEYWFLFLLISAPLFYFGIKKLQEAAE